MGWWCNPPPLRHAHMHTHINTWQAFLMPIVGVEVKQAPFCVSHFYDSGSSRKKWIVKKKRYHWFFNVHDDNVLLKEDAREFNIDDVTYHLNSYVPSAILYKSVS